MTETSKKISTDTLMRRIIRADDLDTFLEKNEEEMKQPDFAACAKSLCEQHHMTPARAIERSQIERTYGHQLFSGRRKPSRDKVIQLAFGIGLTLSETQELLRTAGKSQLYPRLKRDAVILYSLQKRLGMMDVQELLAGHELTILGGIPHDRD